MQYKTYIDNFSKTNYLLASIFTTREIITAVATAATLNKTTENTLTPVSGKEAAATPATVEAPKTCGVIGTFPVIITPNA